MENNIKNNFLDYDKQIWMVPSLESKIARVLKQSKTAYPNIVLLELDEVQEKENDKCG